jgi:hypothetical protein
MGTHCFWKNHLLALVMLTSQLVSCSGYYNGTAEPVIGFQVFYDELSAHGRWIQHSRYGYVWRPQANIDFFPYETNGFWQFTNYGWTWVSHYTWGWAPFHYGRWFFDPFYHWLWIPGYEWGPAWVHWRYAEGFYGWAPLPPELSISIVLQDPHAIPHDHWHFVPASQIDTKSGYQHLTGFADYVRLLEQSTSIPPLIEKPHQPERFQITGPAIADVERIAKRTINKQTLKKGNERRAVQEKNRLFLYKPDITQPDPERKQRQAQPQKPERWKGFIPLPPAPTKPLQAPPRPEMNKRPPASDAEKLLKGIKPNQ